MYCTLFTIASADYTSKSVDLMFGSSNNKRCVVIPVTNDAIPEDPEHFSVMLSMTTPLAGVILTPDNATVVINDDDGKCSDRHMAKCLIPCILFNSNSGIRT